jgi:hypothetical protein
VWCSATTEDVIYWTAQFLVQAHQTLDASGGVHLTVIV